MLRRLTSVEKTAYHEAGHVVAAIYYKRRFIKVSIIPDDESLGRVIYPDSYWKGFLLDKGTTKTRARIEEEILKKFAGEVAEKIASKSSFLTHPREHNRRARELASLVCGSKQELDAFVRWLWKREVYLLQDPCRWAAVESLAKALLEKKEIGYAETRKIIISAIDSYMKKESNQISNYDQIRSHLRNATHLITVNINVLLAWRIADNQEWLLRAGE
jgi:hypothetical protein